MLQKAVIRVTMVDRKKSQKKALQIAATTSGVESVALKGNERDQIEVVGDGIDIVELAKLLRKKVGGADLLSVDPANKEQKQEKPAKKEQKQDKQAAAPEESTPPQVVYTYPSYPPYPVYVITDSEPRCNIL